MGPLVPDQVFYNGKVITVDPAFNIREAFAIKGDRFVAVGSNGEVRALAGPGMRRVNLRGHAVIPGLIDNHNHQYRAAWTMLRGLDMIGVRSLAEMLNRIRQAASVAQPGQTVYASAGWQPRDFPEKRPPTRQELDQAVPNHPVVVIRSRSQIFLNSAALQAAGITRNTNTVAGIPVPKDASGEPTGVINEPPAVTEVNRQLIPQPTGQEKRDLILKMQPLQNAVGLTSIRKLSLAPDIMRIYWDLWREGKLTLRVSMGIEVQASDADRFEELLRPWGVGPGFGNDWLRLDGLAEMGVDSGVEAALVREPLHGEHENFFGDAWITSFPIGTRSLAATTLATPASWTPTIIPFLLPLQTIAIR